ncbi:kinase-like domain-containing protein [Flammula alnicola]|nr:kinase-like domain-containing protein [Flammula alnicola]KAF8965367.1 kinase-like domain-containing protein [Flammula alnicola]
MSTVGHSVDITPVALGNPPQSRTLKKRREREEDDLMMDYFSLDDCRLVPGTEDVEAMAGSTTFLYQTDDTRYETGFTVTVYYWWNECDASCVENQVLQTESHLDLKTFRNEILNRIDNLLPVTLVKVETVNGTLEVSVLPRNLPEEKAYLHIPDTLATVSRVSISLLRKCPVMTSHFHIDIVTIAGDPTGSRYVFKRYGIPIDREDGPMSALLSEVEHLNRLQSPFIIKPVFLVTDDSNSWFRGYLMPFMPAGTLTDVFDDLLIKGNTDQDSMLEPVVLNPKFLETFSRVSGEDIISIKPSISKLSWPLKHTWSIEATSGVVVLHDNGICSGDIKLDNILLGQDGHLQHIDVAPQDGYTELYVAPEFDLLEPGIVFPLTRARDIFALGIVLWQIAEEVGRFEREDRSGPPSLVWRDGQGSTPQWYRDLADRCIAWDVDKRPSARDILDVLHGAKSQKL